jgi:hypothetical protein
MANSIFVSPGVYTRERDLTYVVRQVGVTTLGIAGETPQGPAFEPIFVSNYEEFMMYFGGLDPEKFPGTRYPKYEANYIAKSYLTQSNQLFVTRILGLSGYEAGPAWAITEAATGEVIALIRSRGEYDTTETLNYYVTSLNFTDITAGGDPLGTFTLDGTVAYGAQAGNPFSYEVSFDTTQRSFITRVLGVTATDADAFIYVEEVFNNRLTYLIDNSIATGINTSLDYYATTFSSYLQKWNTPFTPFVVSEVRGNKLFRLFRFIMISDGNSGNRQVKFSIINIKPDTKDFDLIIRDFNDTDEQQIILERWTKLNLRFDDQNFIGRRIGTFNGDFKLSSKFIMVEMAENWPEDSFPAGFEGYLQRDYTPATPTSITYKQTYTTTELSTISRLSRAYLGLSDIIGIDQDFFDYKGMVSSNPNPDVFWTTFTHGFHMDVTASACTVENATIPDYRGGLSGLYTPIFDTGAYTFQTILGIIGTPYERLRARKFTFVPYGGFDGWDVYRTQRTNTPGYVYNGVYATLGLASGIFLPYTTVDDNLGNTSDWYAYYEGIHTFDNPIAVNINVFTTPGITTVDNDNLVYEAIEMVETQRADSIYIVTTPDFEYDEVSGITSYYTAEDIVSILEGQFDSNYTATYWPWIQMNDSENYIQVWMPPTLEVVRNIALTDNIAFPWFATAGVERGSTTAIKARIKLRQADRDTLYEGRINPMATFTEEGVLIWGNKTLQEAETALNRVNVRRLLLQARKLISAVATRLLFDPNDQVVRARFAALVNPILDNIRKERGLYDFRVVVSNDIEEYDRNEMSAKLYLKPTRALEYIIIDFIITPTGASFENI